MLSPTPPIDRPSLHPGTGYLIAPRVPRGLAAVVEGLTREVLRHRPEDIYVFAARHFEKLLKLRQQYHAEEYGGREFNGEFSREFNLWPTKESADDTKGSSIGDRSLDREIEILERSEKAFAEDNPEDVSTGRERRRMSRQACAKGSSSTRKVSRKSMKDDSEAMPDHRATRIISQMSATHGNGRNILTKDIKQELRKNKLNGEKSRTADDNAEKRFRTKVSKAERAIEEKVGYTATTTLSKTPTLKKRPLKKVRRIDTESETETEREAPASKVGLENGSSGKSDNADCEATVARTGSKNRKSEAWLSGRSSERNVSSRALSMDRIRAYVLRKFASTASLEVLRSPTYVEQVQEVIDRAAPIIKAKLEEMRKPRGKRSRSVDLAWDEELLGRHERAKKHDQEEVADDRWWEERRTSGDGSGKDIDFVRGDETDGTAKLEARSSMRRDETIPSVEREGARSRRHSVGSARKSRRRESGDIRIDDDSKHSDKSEREPGAARDTLEARLSATRNILEGISVSASEPDGVRRVDPSGGEQQSSEFESEGLADHGNVVSLPIVRPPSSRNGCRSAAKNGSDSVTLPPISPEAPRSTKKKDELSLPILSAAASNGNYSAQKVQEQDGFKDVEEASTMRDITSDMEDMTVPSEDEREDARNDPIGDTTLDADEGKEDGAINAENIPCEDVARKLVDKRASDASLDRDLQIPFEESAEPEEEKMDEVFKDSLNVTPEVTDLPPRPDSLELDEPEEQKRSRQHEELVTRDSAFEGLRDKLIEIEMAERSIEKALACQETATRDDEEATASGMEKLTADGKMNKKSVVNSEKVASEKGGSTNEAEKSPNETVEEPVVKRHVESLSAINPRSRDKNDRIIGMAAGVTDGRRDDGNMVASKNKADAASQSSTVLENAATQSDSYKLPDESGETGAHKGRRSDESPVARPPTLELPFSYILSEGSPCEIPDSVTTVIIPDRPCPSPVYFETEDQQVGSTSPPVTTGREESTITDRANTEVSRVETQDRHGAEAFGEYIRPEVAALPLDIDFMHDARGGKSSQDIVIIHQDLDKIKEEREEEEEQREEKEEEDKEEKKKKRGDEERKEQEGCRCEKGDDRTTKLATLEEREENEETDAGTILGSVGSNEAEISISRVPETSSDTAELTSEGRTDVAVESKSALETSSVESGSSQDTRTTTSSDAKESCAASNRSVESPGVGRPIVPELNLDSLQDNTVSSFKITGNDTATKGSNDSLRESDTTMSFVEPLTPDEKEAIENRSTDPEREAVADEFASRRASKDLQSELPEADRTEYDWLEPSSSDTTMEAEAKPQEKDIIDSKPTPDDAARNDTVLREKRETQGLGSEEEIARELIGSLDEELQLGAEGLNRNKGSADSGKSVADGNLDDVDKSDQTLLKLEHLVAVGQPEKEEREVSSEKSETSNVEKLASTEVVRELSSNISQDNKDKDKEEARPVTADQPEKEEHEVSTEKTKTSNVEELASAEVVRGLSANISQDNKDKDKKEVRPVMADQPEKEEHEVSTEKSGTSNIEKLANTELVRELSANISQDNKDKDKEEAHQVTADQPEKKEHQVSERSETSNVEKFTRAEVVEELSANITQDNKDKDKEEAHLVTADQPENKEHQVSERSETSNVEKFTGTEVVEKLSTNINQDNKNKKEEIKDEKIEGSELKVEEQEAQSEQDKSLRQNGKCETTDEKIIPGSKPDTIDTDPTNSKKESIDEKTSIEEILKVQSNKTADKVEQDSHEKQEESEHDKSEDEKYEQEKARKESMEGAVHDGTDLARSISCNEIITNDSTEKSDERKENLAGVATKVESVHGPITNAISQQSTDESFRLDRCRTIGTKSSTVETVIAAFGSKMSSDEKPEAPDSTPEVVEGESSARRTDDVYLAAIKIQAYIRGFLARHRARKNLRSKSPADVVTSAQKPATTDEHLAPSRGHADARGTRSGRHPLRREEALRKTTLSLENAFVTGRLQHTSEFHDTVPLPLFDTADSETNSIPSNESSGREAEERARTKPDVEGSTGNGDDGDHSSHDDESREAFLGDNVDRTAFPIVMHLLADASRNRHFRIGRNDESDFHSSAGGAEPTLDILMVGYPGRDDDATLQNRYLNFITSVEDASSNMDSLLDETIKSPKGAEESHPSVTSAEGSLREPLALPGTPPGVLIEELTSLDETTEDVSTTKSESEPSTAPRSSLDTNSSVPTEERSPENEKKSDLGRSSPRVNAIESEKDAAGVGAEEKPAETPIEKTDLRKLANVGEIDLCGDDASEKFSVCRNGNGYVGVSGRNGKT